MKIALNKAHYPVTVLGPGQRIGLWFQGCSIHCPGCVSQDTWAFDRGRETTVARILSWAREVSADRPEGITLTGGEPFDQPKALAALLEALEHWRRQQKLDFDILAYSGYPLAQLRQKHARLLARLDALIPEPFRQELPLTQLWRGSSNQPLVPLSPRGQARYAPYLEAAAASDRRLQLSADGERLWFVGIPGRGDLDAVAARLREDGVEIGEASWHEGKRS